MTDLHALLDAHQNTRLLRMAFPENDGPQATLMVNRFVGTEYVSRDFDYTVELLSDDARIEREAIHGKLLCISLVQADGSLRPFTGYVSSFKLVKTDGGVAFYEAVLRPWLAYTRLRRNNRLFHRQSVRQQTEKIFAGYGSLPDYDWKVAGEQPQFTMATQWDETDHNYLCRRWEAAGYSYWYEHTGDGHVLKVCDDTRTADPINGPSPGIRFHGAGGAVEEDALSDWSALRQWASGQATVSGFDFKHPYPIHAGTVTIAQQGDVPKLEVHSYEGHYGFLHHPGASRLSRLRMEEIEARSELYEARGNNRRVAAGRWFKLLDHFSESEDSEFLILEVHHEASNNYLQGKNVLAEYRNRVLCQNKTVPWFPGRGFNSTTTRLLALQTAIVVGPEGQSSLNVDEYGRIQVRFHWDRDETSSCWVRVGSNWAGGEKGLASHPRVGCTRVTLLVTQADSLMSHNVHTHHLLNIANAAFTAKVSHLYNHRSPVKAIVKLFELGYVFIVILFFACGIGLVVLAGVEIWAALSPSADTVARERFDLILECIGMLTIAVAALGLGQTVLEEEIQREANISSPTRVRRFLSRFLIVVVVSLSVECLIGVFQFVHGSPEYLPHAASIGVAAAALLATWGLFVRMNVSAEELEPHAMHDVQAEDKVIEGEDVSEEGEQHAQEQGDEYHADIDKRKE